jgi:hypothetical protein
MIYMDADNNLEPAAFLDLKELQSVGSTSNVNILVLLDRYSVNGSEILYITRGGNETIWGGWSNTFELNMSDPRTLVFFINYVVQRYPADHYMLVIWDHGNGWMGVSWDDTNGGYLTMEGLKSALESVNVNIDVLGFDACLMANVEVAYTLALTGKVHVMVASEDYEPWYGWPYDAIMNYLVNNPNTTPEELAKVIVEEYVKSYEHGSQGFAIYVTMSAINLDYVKDLVTSMKPLVTVLINNMAYYWSDITAAKDSADRYWFGYYMSGPYIDLYTFLTKLSSMNPTLRQYVSPVLAVWDKVVISTDCVGGPHVNGCYGLTIYFPRNRNIFYLPEPYYNAMPEFATETQWYLLLTKYYSMR